MTHDFKGALEWFERRNRGMTIYEDHPYVAVVIALKLADRLMGEPSEAMTAKGVSHALNSSIGGDYDWVCYTGDMFKAMRDQLLAEVKNEMCI